MTKSIIQKDKVCFVCGSPHVEDHHIYFGPDRKVSEKYGFKVWLCPEHHRGNAGAHLNRPLDLALKELCQREYEKTHTRQEFMDLIGKSYL